MDGINNAGSGRAEARKGNAFFIAIGWIAAVLSLFRYPFIFGVLGVIMGILATKSGSRAGLAVIIANIILMSVGLIFSDVIWNYTMHFLGYR